MGKIFQHFYKIDKTVLETVAASQELSGVVVNHLENNICNFKNGDKNESVYSVSLTKDVNIYGCATYNADEDLSEESNPNIFYHNYLVAKGDIARLICADPGFVPKIRFIHAQPVTLPVAEALDELPLSREEAGEQKLSGKMIVNSFCTLFDILSTNSMRYMGVNEPFSPLEVVSLAYSVLPIHVAVALTFATYSGGVPKIQYNLVFTDLDIVARVKPEKRLSASLMFSPANETLLDRCPRLKALLEKSSIGFSELKAFYKFAYDFINIVNKNNEAQLNSFKADLYEALLCLHVYYTDLITISKSDLPQDVINAFEWLNKIVSTNDTLKEELLKIVPALAPYDEPKQLPQKPNVKRVEREIATKIIAMIITNPKDFKEFALTKYEIMREARLGTVDLQLFQQILREGLSGVIDNEIDEIQLRMVTMAVSLAFETISYKEYGSRCISYAPYDYPAMLDFIDQNQANFKRLQRDLTAIHININTLQESIKNHKHPSKIKAKKFFKAKMPNTPLFLDDSLDGNNVSEKNSGSADEDIIQDESQKKEDVADILEKIAAESNDSQYEPEDETAAVTLPDDSQHGIEDEAETFTLPDDSQDEADFIDIN